MYCRTPRSEGAQEASGNHAIHAGYGPGDLTAGCLACKQYVDFNEPYLAEPLKPYLFPERPYAPEPDARIVPLPLQCIPADHGD